MISSIKEMEAKEKKQSYFRAVQQELKKISWTPKKELISSTKVVLISTLIFSFVIYLADIVIHSCFSSINSLVRLIFG